MSDSAVREAIEAKLGEGFERSPERVRALDVLTVNHARGLDGLAACENLAILVLAGCEPANLHELSRLASLGLVSFADSAVGSIGALSGLALHTVHIERSEALDITPLLDCSGLVEVHLKGSALADHAYDTVIPQLRERGIDVVCPDATERELTALLRDKGLRMNYYRRGQEYRLCRPGLSLTERPEVNHPPIAPDDLRAMVASDPAGVAALFDRTL
ncbi:hypothetical protein ACF1BN_07930 [Streptomyces sp. NPDC014861]|uniref:hypothetical protein n=1 Tax=Streptomyces sp. NPDC014861 TaxID=3364923 RepID=UPI0036FA5803